MNTVFTSKPTEQLAGIVIKKGDVEVRLSISRQAYDREKVRSAIRVDGYRFIMQQHEQATLYLRVIIANLRDAIRHCGGLDEWTEAHLRRALHVIRSNMNEINGFLAAAREFFWPEAEPAAIREAPLYQRAMPQPR